MTPRVPLRLSVGLLAVAGVAAAFVSDWFVGSLGPAIESLGISEEFTGLVIVGIAGNAVENVVGVVLAHKGQSDLAISVVKNSVAQIAVFLFPLLVLLSLFLETRLTFVLPTVYIAALFLMAISVWQTTQDGEAAALRGARARRLLRDPRRAYLLRMRDILETLAAWDEEGLRAAWAIVVETERSTPREPGAALAVNERGDVAGSVTGGCVEPAVVEEAQAVLAGGPARLVEYGIEDETAFEVGLPCGGTVRILIGPVDFEVVRELA